MLKIMFVYPFGLVGGIETLFATIINNMLAEHDISTMAAIPAPIMPWASAAMSTQYTILAPYTDGSNLAAVIDKYKPHILVTALAYNAGAALRISTHKPHVVETAHNLYHSVGDSISLVRPYIKHIISVSNSVDKNVQKYADEGTPRSVIITGVNMSRFRVRTDLRAACRQYAYFGRLSLVEKGIDHLLAGFADTLGNSDAVLNIYGKAATPEQDIQIRNLAKGKYRQANICFKGFVQNPENYLHHNDVFVIRSPLEGYCNAVVEALACGIPVVAYNFQGILDHLPQGTCLVSDSQARFRQHLHDVRNLTTRKTMRQRGLDFVAANASDTVMTQAYLKVFRQVAAPEQVVLTPTLQEVPVAPEEQRLVVSNWSEHPDPGIHKVVGICSQYSQSIKDAMAGAGALPVEFPYSPQALPLERLLHTAGLITNASAETVIFNAACASYKDLLLTLRQRRIRCLALFHGSFCGYSFDHLFDATERTNLQTMLDWQRQGLVECVGFVNRDSATFYAGLGYKTAWVPNVPEITETSAHKPIDDGRKHIGVFTRFNAMKNTAVGVAAALAVENSVVHVCEPPPWLMPGMDHLRARIAVHGWMPHDGLLDAMARMHVTVMPSFTESYGLLVTQSWAVGTPCVVGPACRPLFVVPANGWSALDAMFVERPDDVVRWKECIEESVENHQDLGTLCRAAVHRLRGEAQVLFRRFADV